MTLLEEKSQYLFAAVPALDNQSAPWPVSEDDKTQYGFHSGLLVIKNRNWKEHFLKEENPSWQKIATLHADLNFRFHDQTVLQYAAQGRFLHLPPDFVNFATKMDESTRIVTSGVWKKSWTIPREQYFKYISSLMMYQNYKEVFGVVKELEIYSRYEDEMLDYLSLDKILKQKILENKLQFQTVFKIRHNIPFLANKVFFEVISFPRRLISFIK
jgi:lipopolysaccharide biosynthesis glycosyltransferase